MWANYERSNIRLAVGDRQQECGVLVDAEHISTIAGSMGSIGTNESQVSDQRIEPTAR